MAIPRRAVRTSVLAGGALLFAVPAAAFAQEPAHCLDISDLKEVEVTLQGHLTRHVFPGPPNYADVRLGDTPEPTYILELRSPICLYDGETARTDRVHLYTSHDVWARLRGGLDRNVRVHGRGFGEITGHHHAPLVVDVDEIVVERR